jgi:hypothetical protein
LATTDRVAALNAKRVTVTLGDSLVEILEPTGPVVMLGVSRTTHAWSWSGYPERRLPGLDAVLHIHSNRFAKLPRLRGESWVETVRRQPRVRVAIAGQIYRRRAMPIDSPEVKAAILSARGYWHAWDGITIFRVSIATIIASPRG